MFIIYCSSISILLSTHLELRYYTAIICLSLTQHFTLNNIHSISVIHFDQHTLHF